MKRLREGMGGALTPIASVSLSCTGGPVLFKCQELFFDAKLVPAVPHKASGHGECYSLKVSTVRFFSTSCLLPHFINIFQGGWLAGTLRSLHENTYPGICRGGIIGREWVLQIGAHLRQAPGDAWDVAMSRIKAHNEQ